MVREGGLRGRGSTPKTHGNALKGTSYLLDQSKERFLEVHVGCYASAKWTSFFVSDLSCVKDGENGL